MKLFEAFRTDNRAVSPVLGVALLIAMTVILAGVVGYVALGVDADSANAPSASLKFTEETVSSVDKVYMHHKGGPVLDGANVVAKVEGTGTPMTISGDVATGSKTEVATAVDPGDVVSIVWQDPNSDREVLLAEYVVE
ncbi:type IV pilin N-terminal domain-containing protein [Halogeometricum sp. S1BR25-6]|uniref:Type IV pilin N-terminal domain-containing protein n=1 Tax=Halogeometricum salsisoli TaxID=2950536 RepID=A0ABU2GH90_9EURY|nr:type IV pilin N-terminal domain-containing protein [Halogeometricum sp. S1BR25-6]MDS0300166.1 type IV pilin N-terminal domain-containing protein [Halogeometricum sp. S1BR25-6]